ncbi:MAG: hypothetical protein R3C14_40985 [Caldilineaceae bacterium]
MQSYTFHVTLPGHGRTWRKVELSGEDTLEALHLAIQDAYDFDADHLYSFFMSGKAWDQSTEYNLPEGASPWGSTVVLDEEGEEFEDEEDGAEEDDEDTAMSPFAGLEGMAMPNPEQIRMMMQMLQSDAEARQQFIDAMSTQMGVPPAMAQMIVGNLAAMTEGMSDEDLNSVLQMGNPFGAQEEAQGDVRVTTLDSLQLRKGQTFLYLFDYGDEWRFNVRVHAINPNADAALEYPRLVESVGEAPPQYPDWDEDDEEWDEDWDDDTEDDE